MGEQTDREAMLREMAKKNVVYQMPGMDVLRVRRDLTFRSTSGAGLLMDVYYPSVTPSPPLPTMLLPVAYPAPMARVRAYGPVTSWARLMAASGMAAVVYGAESPEEDVHAVLRQLRSDAEALGLDMDKFGLFATSGNVTVALSVLMRDRRVRCAALLYGYTMDMDGSTAVADMGRQAGFGNACAGKSPDDLPDGVPMLFIRAGRDQFPGVNEALDKVIARALARNLPLSLVNHAAGEHGFDLDENTAIARGIVQHVLAFLRLHLDA
jgi:dienelactone hydrolase